MTEQLNVPEENLEEVIKVIRAGLKAVKVSRDVKYNLNKWCDEEEEYLNESDEDDEEITEKPKKKLARKKKK